MSLETAPDPKARETKPKVGGLIGALSSIAFGLLACLCMALMWIIDKTLFPVRIDGIGGLFEAILIAPLALGFVGFSAAAVLVGFSTLLIRPSLTAVAATILGAVPWVGLYYSPMGQEYIKTEQLQTARSAAASAAVLRTQKELSEILRTINATAPASLAISGLGYNNTCFAKPSQPNKTKESLWGECNPLEQHGEILIDPIAAPSLMLRVTLEDSVHTVDKSQLHAKAQAPNVSTSRLSMSFRGDLISDKTAGTLRGNNISGTIDQVFEAGIKDRSVQVNGATFEWIPPTYTPDSVPNAKLIFELEPYEQRPAVKYEVRLKVASR